MNPWKEDQAKSSLLAALTSSVIGGGKFHYDILKELL
jgi:hypothetical protein